MLGWSGLRYGLVAGATSGAGIGGNVMWPAIIVGIIFFVGLVYLLLSASTDIGDDR